MIRLLTSLFFLFLYVHTAQAEPLTSFFSTPSGNIYCVFMGPDAYGNDAYVVCDIWKFAPSFTDSYAARTLDPLTNPAGNTCTADKLSRYVIESKSNAGINFCPTLDPPNPENSPELGSYVEEMKYGRTVTRNGFTCDTSKNGLTCKNLGGHGFFLSRAKQAVF